jgi:hypothetical protein
MSFTEIEAKQKEVDRKKTELSLGKDVSNPVPVKSVGAEYTYLQVHPCECGEEWIVKKQRLVSKGSGAYRIDELTVQCNSCGSESSFFFRVERTAEEAEAKLQAFKDSLKAKLQALKDSLAEAELQAGEAKLQALKDSRHELKKTEIVQDTSVVRTQRWWQFWR